MRTTLATRGPSPSLRVAGVQSTSWFSRTTLCVLLFVVVIIVILGLIVIVEFGGFFLYVILFHLLRCSLTLAMRQPGDLRALFGTRSTTSRGSARPSTAPVLML